MATNASMNAGKLSSEMSFSCLRCDLPVIMGVDNNKKQVIRFLKKAEDLEDQAFSKLEEQNKAEKFLKA